MLARLESQGSRLDTASERLESNPVRDADPCLLISILVTTYSGRAVRPRVTILLDVVDLGIEAMYVVLTLALSGTGQP